ncbi:MAG TPA: extracellular solute-binding protein [Chloroflexota bacterium]|jgi:iron(III) transport system substrate-binding protein
MRRATGVGRLVNWALVGVVLLGVGACAPSAAPSRPPSAGASPPQAASAPAASGSTGQNASPGAGAAASPAASGPADWDATVAAARQEGKLVISAPTGQLWREALEAFTQDYPGISLEMTGGNSRDFWPRLFQERDAGQFLWDLRVGGPDPEVFDARDRGALDPVRPLLVLPEVMDESKWFGGFDGMYADKAKEYLPAFVASASYNVYVNRNVIPESELSSEEQLIDPRWRGKIVIQDPRGGAGLGTTTTQLAAFGEDYVRQLFTQQDVVVTGDNRQQAEWVVRNRYPIGIGLRMDQVKVFEQQGLAVNVQGLGTPRKLSLGSGGIQLISQRPHPNAAKVFVNWLLTQKEQERIAKAVETNSRRLDVPPGDMSELLEPSQMAQYVPHQYEELLPTRRRAQQLAAELIK